MGFKQRHIIPDIYGVDWTSRCEGCECHSNIIPSDGPVPARVFLIGERPGADEALRSMKPFSGKSGRELNNNYLELAGLTRDEVYLVNVAKCYHPKNQAPGKQLIQSCSSKFLPFELEAVRPTFIIPMGGTACSLFENIHLATHHGMPLRRKIYGKTYWVVPQYHPALGLHDPRKMTPMLEDWARLRRILDGDYIIPKDPYPNPDYRLVHGRAQVEQYLRPDTGFPKWVLYGGLDTETDAGRLWCITVSVAPGTGIMILASDHEGVAAFRELCNHYHWFIHNAIFDLDKLSEADIHLKNVTCTMQAAYHRGNLPQGLKQLAWRLLGITMTEYEDVVIPWSKIKLQEWWLEALMHLDKEQIVTRRVSEKTGKELKPSVKSTKLFSRMAFIYKHDLKDEKGTYDMWKMWDKLTETEGITEADRRHVLDLVGPPPRQSIIHVPMADGIDSDGRVSYTGAITYACRDCCAGLRLGLHFRSQERQIRRSMTTVVG